MELLHIAIVPLHLKIHSRLRVDPILIFLKIPRGAILVIQEKDRIQYF